MRYFSEVATAAMPAFGQAGVRPGALDRSMIGRLTTRGTGSQATRQALEGLGVKVNKAVGTITVSASNRRILGSKWGLLGGAGTPNICVQKLMGDKEDRKGWTVKLKLSDLSIFTFGGADSEDNLSEWVDGRSLVSAVKKDREPVITDRTAMDAEMDKMSLKFVCRVCVIPAGGNELLVSLGAAPVSMEEMRAMCVDKGCKVGSSRIPVMEIKIAHKERGNVKRMEYGLCEAAWQGPEGWLLFPLLEIAQDEPGSSDGNVPKSEDIRREFFGRLRNCKLPEPSKEVWKFYDHMDSEGAGVKGVEWPALEKWPKERWPVFQLVREGDASEEELIGEFKLLVLNTLINVSRRGVG